MDGQYNYPASLSVKDNRSHVHVFRGLLHLMDFWSKLSTVVQIFSLKGVTAFFQNKFR
jgi:hypothetical protein